MPYLAFVIRSEGLLREEQHIINYLVSLQLFLADDRRVDITLYLVVCDQYSLFLDYKI